MRNEVDMFMQSSAQLKAKIFTKVINATLFVLCCCAAKIMYKRNGLLGGFLIVFYIYSSMAFM